MRRDRTETLREILALARSLASPFVRVRMTLTLVLITIASALTALGPVALKLVVEKLTRPDSTSLALPIAAIIGFYVVSQWLSRVVGEIRGLVYAHAELRMARALSERAFSHMMHLPLRFHLNSQTGALTQTLNNGLRGCQLVLQFLVFALLPVTTELATIVIVLSRIDHPIFIGLFCGALVCYAAAFTCSAVTIRSVGEAVSAAHVQATAAMADSLMSYETVKLFTAERTAQERVGRALACVEKEGVRFFRRFAFNGLGIAGIYATFLAVAVSYATHEVLMGQMSIGTFVLINSYMLQVVRPVETLGSAAQNLAQGLAYLEQLMALFRLQPEAGVALAEHEPVRNRPGMVELDNVSFAYSATRPAVRNITLRVAPGRTLGIVGASGAGKSTLTRLLTRLMEPDTGRILLDGVPVAEISLAKLRQAIAVVPQDAMLFDDTIAYNIGVGRAGSSQADIEAAARIARLHEFITELPEKYATKVGERGVRLSGGEKQRLAIARAVLKRPRIYVFDEATSSLDSATERQILVNLRELAHHATTLVIAHRLSSVVHADEIVVLDAGEIAQRGTHSSLLRLKGIYARLWQAQEQGERSGGRRQ